MSYLGFYTSSIPISSYQPISYTASVPTKPASPPTPQWKEHPSVERVKNSCGIGIVFKEGNTMSREKGLVVETVVPGMAADRSQKKIENGDIITHIDGAPTSGWMDEVVEAKTVGMRSGSLVTVTVQKKNQATFQATLVRGSWAYWEAHGEREALEQKVKELEDHLAAANSANEFKKMNHDSAHLSAKNDVKRLTDVLAAESEAKKTTEVRMNQFADTCRRLEGQIQGLEKGAKISSGRNEALQDELSQVKDKLRAAEQAAKGDAAKRAQAEEREKTAQAALLMEVEKQRGFDQERNALTAKLQALADKCAEATRRAGTVTELQTENEEMARELKATKESLAKAQQQAAHDSALARQLQSELSQTKSKMETMETEVKTAMKKHEKLEELKKAAQSESSKHSSLSQSNESKIRTLSEQNEKISKMLELAQSAANTMKSELVVLKEEHGKSQVLLNASNKALEENREALASVKKQLEAITAENQKLKVATATATKECEVMSKKLAEHDALIKENLKNASEAAKYKQSSQVLEQELNALKRHHEDLRRDYDSAVEGHTALLNKFNTMERSLTNRMTELLRTYNEDLYKLTSERDRAMDDLRRFLEMPNPCGVGMRIMTFADARGGQEAKVFRVTELVPGLSADLSGLVKTGDIILEVDGKKTDQYSLEEVKAMIYGPRGTRIAFTVQRMSDEALKVDRRSGAVAVVKASPRPSGVVSVNSDEAYTISSTIVQVTLKRGAWGPEHSMVSIEQGDALEQGRWKEDYGGLPRAPADDSEALVEGSTLET